MEKDVAGSQTWRRGWDRRLILEAAHDKEHERIAERLDRLVERVSELEEGARAKPAEASEAGKRWVIVMSGVPERYFTPYAGFISNPTWDTLYTWSDRIEAENICESLFPGDRRISVREAP